MKRYVHVLIVLVCFVLLAAPLATATQLFERNGLGIDGYDPVAYLTERKPVKGAPSRAMPRSCRAESRQLVG